MTKHRRFWIEVPVTWGYLGNQAHARTRLSDAAVCGRTGTWAETYRDPIVLRAVEVCDKCQERVKCRRDRS